MEKIDLKSVKIALEKDEMLEIAGGSGFWGWTGWSSMGPCTNGMQSMYRQYNVFWIGTGQYDYNVVSC